MFCQFDKTSLSMIYRIKKGYDPTFTRTPSHKRPGGHISNKEIVLRLPHTKPPRGPGAISLQFDYNTHATKKGVILRLPVHPASSGQEVTPLHTNYNMTF